MTRLRLVSRALERYWRVEMVPRGSCDFLLASRPPATTIFRQGDGLPRWKGAGTAFTFCANARFYDVEKIIFIFILVPRAAAARNGLEAASATSSMPLERGRYHHMPDTSTYQRWQHSVAIFTWASSSTASAKIRVSPPMPRRFIGSNSSTEATPKFRGADYIADAAEEAPFLPDTYTLAFIIRLFHFDARPLQLPITNILIWFRHTMDSLDADDIQILFFDFTSHFYVQVLWWALPPLNASHATYGILYRWNKNNADIFDDISS